jgi:hypothetical protein
MRHDFIFSTSTPEDNSDLPDLPYGRGGACSAEGYFRISLQGTGLKFRNKVYIFHLLSYMISDVDFMIVCYSGTFFMKVRQYSSFVFIR